MGGAIPVVDPIPLPAPVWLFKFLDLLVLALHFCAVELLLGGLLISTAWALAAYRNQDPVLRNARGAVAARLPIVTAFVINLGVPPLLFTQVLYGRALYTSSVVMGIFWIALIFILMFGYFLLYRAAAPSGNGKLGFWLGVLACAALLKVAYLLSSNMTLMLRPEAWLEMYRANPHGAQLPSGDPTILPRWLYMVSGSIGIAGVGIMLLGLKRGLGDEVRLFMQRWGARLAAAFIPIQAGVGYWAFQTQPQGVREGLLQGAFNTTLIGVWAATMLLLTLLGLAGGWGASVRRALPMAMAAASFGNIAAMVLLRDAIRDLTLAAKGFDVWQRTVAANWAIVGLFFFLLVTAIGFVGWMIWVLTRMRETEERYA
ncbi:MAG TPA: hypothetical protein PKZ01_08780 [Candidatus Hydrogenedentes bacterium]|nr:hypothetical protein [Candidatus Hydrogenedentota bacterium]